VEQQKKEKGRKNKDWWKK